MDDRRFDSLTKALARGQSRRSVLKGLLGLGGAAAISGTLLDGSAEAARRPTPTPKPVKCPGNQTWNSTSNTCVCPSTLSQCNANGGPACCNDQLATPGDPGYSTCCDNACCNGTCYGEELCCRTNSRAGGLPPTHEFCDGTCVDLTVAGNCCDDGDCDDPCQICNHASHICVDRCDAQTQICCTGQVGPGVCFTGNCCDNSDCPSIDACNTNTCRDHQCVATPVVCDDNNACTVDSCDPVTGCVFTPVICDDHNACTVDTCDPRLGCIFTKVDCDDGNACTVDTCDSALGCIHEAVSCDDHNVCTIDTCDPILGCIHTAVDCNDNNACTIDRCDPDLGCGYTAVDCDDGDPCTIDSCDTVLGCNHTPVNCDDGNPCTNSVCSVEAGGCVNTPIDCSALDDPERCLVGVCVGGACTAAATCSQDETCLGDGTCGVAQTCVGETGTCQNTGDCCAGCCILNLPSQDDWLKVCTDSNISGTAAILCAQAIQEQGYPGTCLTNNVIVLGGDFPPVTLPCAI